mmetsp:Transcript_39888/g.65771  ORF Transcript_39888/g.65771 Transcript_39888/m.65771 type:complete len:144 (-) Transcript_39888:312-743(-)
MSDNRTSGVELLVAHHAYHMDWLTDDIALLRVTTALPSAKYAKLEDGSRRHAGSKALIAGWGTIDEHCTQIDDVLREGPSTGQNWFARLTSTPQTKLLRALAAETVVVLYSFWRTVNFYKWASFLTQLQAGITSLGCLPTWIG